MRPNSAARTPRFRRGTALAAAGLLAAGTIVGTLVAAGPAVAGPPSATANWSVVTDGAVRTMARSGGTVYVGGIFHYLGTNTGSLVKLSGNSVVPEGLPSVTDGMIDDVTTDGAGGWYVSGQFTSIGGVNRTDLAHVLSDGSVDPNWNPPASINEVRAVILAGGFVYVGGGEFQVSGTTYITGLARLDPVTGALDTTYAPLGGQGQYVASGFAVSGDHLYISGTSPNTSSGLIDVDAASGNVVSAPMVDGGISAMAVDGNSLYLAGQFTTVAGQPRQNIAELDTTTDTATSWNPTVTGSVSSIAVASSTVYLTGQFSAVDGVARQRVAGLDRSAGSVTDFNPATNTTTANYTRSVAVSGNTLYYTDDFTTIGGQARDALAAFDATTGALLPDSAALQHPARVLVPDGSNLIAGGSFQSAGGAVRGNLGALSASTGQVLPLNTPTDATVWSLATDGSTLYTGGDFTMVAGQSRNHLAAVDLTSGTVSSWNPGADQSVLALALSDNSILAGGSFTTLGGTARANLGAVGADGTVTAWNPGANGTVDALAVGGSGVFVGGSFSTLGGASRVRLGQIDLVSGAATAWYPGAVDNVVNALALDGNSLYVGGVFANIGSVSRADLAQVDASSAAVTSWDAQISGPFQKKLGGYGQVKTIAVTDDQVAFAGFIDSVGPVDREYLASVDKSSAAVSDWYPTDLDQSSVSAMLVVGNTLVLGGSTINGYALPVSAVAPANVTAPVASGTAMPGSTVSCDLGTWSGVPSPSLSDQWLANESPISGATASSYVVQPSDYGANLSCLVTATNSAGTATAESNVLTPPPSAPVNTGLPAVVGTVQAGSTVTCSPGTWQGVPAPSFGFAWLRSGKLIAGTTSDTYGVLVSDAGKTISCRVTATNPSGSATATSAAITVPATAAPSGGTPTVQGTVAVGQTLTCAAGPWTGAPTPTLSYDWQRNSAEIGVTRMTYPVTSADIGTKLRCLVTGTNAVRSVTKTSAQVSVPAVPVNTSIPRITGTAAVGQTLSCSTGSWTAAPTGYAYSWSSGGQLVAGESANTYVVRSADAGSSVTCSVAASNSSGTGAAATSLAKAVPAAPVLTAAPSITPTTKLTVGRVLTINKGTWSGTGITYTRLWYRNGVVIAGQTGTTYTLTAADLHTTISCTVTASNGGGSATATATLAIP